MEVVSTFDERPIYFRSREHTPTTTATDVNFNSPGHRSSQDGSFIQDEDMHLILEFGKPKNSTSDLNQLALSPASVSTSWRGRNAEWATNFDVNVAELDFDDFSASRDISTLKGARYADDGTVVTATTMPSSFHGYLRSKIYDLQRSKLSNNADCNHNKINKRLMMRNSMEISFGINEGSMFSSSGGGLLCDENVDERRMRRSVIVDDTDIDNGEEAMILDRRNGGALAFISTDSLDLSSLSVTEENLKAVCATKKREYVLTFDKAAFESGVGASSSINYDNTATNFDDGNDSSFERSTYDNDDDNQFYNYYRPAEQADGVGDCGFTTWDRVKRSYELGGPQIYLGSSKCTSLPNLNPSPIVPQRLYIFDGAEEKMASNNSAADDENNSTAAAVVPTSDDVQEMSLSTSSRAWHTNRPASNDNVKHGISLLQAFRNKCSPTLYGDEKLTVPDQNNADISNDSSGYVTGGTGSSSQQGYCATTNAEHAQKFISSPNLTSDKQLTSSKNIVDDDYGDLKNNQNTNYRPQFVLVNDDDYEYAEFFVNGRYIDVNHNEIGFVPPSTTSVQRSSPVTTVWASTVSSRRPSSTTVPPIKPPRTFATLLEQNGININDYVAASDSTSSSINFHNSRKSNSSSDLKDSSTQIPVYVVDQSVQTSSNDGGKLITVVTTSVRSLTTDKPSYVTRTVAVSPPPSSRTGDAYFGNGIEKHSNNYHMPDLSFMKFPFIMPPLNPTLTPFLLQFLGESPTLGDVLATSSPSNSFNKPKLATTTTTSFHLSQHTNFNNTSPFSLPDPPKLLSPRSVGDRHDSGLGGSSSGAAVVAGTGPAHIQDWESLAMLLPKDVVQACSFFKANTNLLRSIDKPPRGTSTQRSSATAPSSKKRPPLSCRGGYQYLPRKSRQFASEPSSLKHCNRFESIAEEIEYCPVCQQKQQYQCCDGEVDRCDIHRCRYENNCQRNLLFNHHFCCDLSSDSIHTSMRRRRRHNNDHHREFASLTTSSRPTWCHQPSVCRQNDRRTCCSCVVNSTSKSNYCCQNVDHKNICKCRSCDDCHRVSSSVNCHQTDENYYRVDQPPSMYDDGLLFRSEFCCRPQVDLTGVQKFYSIPNFNIISTAGPAAIIADDDDDEGVRKACATCYRVRSPSAERSYHDFFCDCRTSDIIETESYHRCLSSLNDCDGTKNEMNLNENCENLKDLVSHIVDCCIETFDKFAKKSAEKEVDNGEKFNGAVGAIVFNSLCPSVEALLTDGLLEGRYLWMVVQSSVCSDPTNQNIYTLVRAMGSTEGNSRERSLQFATFISGLLSLRLFDIWLMMVIRNESMLLENYCDSSYVRLLDDETIEILLDAAKRLKGLPFERLGLIDVGFLSTITSEQHQTEPTTIANESKFYPVERPKDLKSVVSLEKELRFMFRAPVTEWMKVADDVVRELPPSTKILCTQSRDDDDDDDEIYVSMSESSKKSSLIPKSFTLTTMSTTPKLNRSLHSSSSKSSSVDDSPSHVDPTSTTTTPSPSKKSRIPMLMKTKLTSPTTAKNNLHITITNQTTKNYSKNDSSSTSNGKHFTYDKSYVCTVEKFNADRSEFLSFDAGETLILLEEYPNGLLKCDRRGVLGLVQRDKITYISFL